MNDWKLVVGVIAGSLFVVVLAAFGLNKMVVDDRQGAEVGVAELIDGAGWMVGSDDAKVVVVEFADLQCPACKKAEPIAIKLMSTPEVKYVYRHLPLEIPHKNAVSAARLAEAAKMQGQGWEMMQLLFDRQSEWSDVAKFETKVTEYGEDIGVELELTKLKEDYESESTRKQIDVDLALARKLKLNGTPTFFVNGKLTASSFVLVEVEKLLGEENK